jgi:hypothetical protein
VGDEDVHLLEASVAQRDERGVVVGLNNAVTASADSKSITSTIPAGLPWMTSSTSNRLTSSPPALSVRHL